MNHNFTTTPGRMFDGLEAAERAIEVYPERFPAGYLYYVETRRHTPDRGRTVVTHAVVCAYARDGVTFLGYVERPEGI